MKFGLAAKLNCLAAFRYLLFLQSVITAMSIKV